MQAAAERVILARLDQPPDDPQSFLQRLSGLLRYAISHYNGQTSLDQLAAALGQNRAAIELGLTWWQAHGDIFLQISDEGECTIEKNTAGAKTSIDELTQIAQRPKQSSIRERRFPLVLHACRTGFSTAQGLI